MTDPAVEAVKDWMTTGVRDAQTVTPDWIPVTGPTIDGVAVKEIRSVPVGTGSLTEIWRREWNLDPFPVDQIFQRVLDPGGVTGWHAHAVTTDRLFCATGRVKVSLFDGRKSSRTFGTVWHRIIGEERPVLIIVPPGIWHGVTGLGAKPSILLNLVDKAYGYESPDHWRLPPDTPHIPFSLV